MKSKRSFWGAAVAALAVVGVAPAFAQTEFTYQGQLRDVGVPANGDYDFIFLLYDASDGGSQVGIPVNIDDWPVENGVFTVELDFGTSVFTGAPRWLQILVRPGASGGLYAGLTPRQPLTAVPYAMYAFDGPGGGGDGFWNGSDSDIYNNNTGGVGIGIESAEEKLHVDGAILSDGANGGSFIARNPNNAEAAISLSWLNDVARLRIGGDGIGATNGLDIQRTSDVSIMRLLQNGRVGIGTTTPSAKLHVGGVGGEDGIMFPDGTLQTTAAIGGGGDSVWSLNGSTAYYNAGKVGIGTNTPQGELEVRSSTFPNLRIAKIFTGGFGVAAPAVLELQSNFTNNDVPYGVINFLDENATARGSIDYGADDTLLGPSAMRFKTEGLSRIAITASGDVGIGTTSPQVNLEVNQPATDAGPAIRVNKDGDTLDIGANSIDTAGDGFFGDPLYLNGTSSSSVLLGFGGGNVGVGGGAAGLPVVRLHVDGGSDANVTGATSGYFLIGESGGANVVMDNNEIMSRNNGSTSTLHLNADGGAVIVGSNAGNNTLSTPILQVTGGSDLSEQFDVSADGEVEPGMVVSIDPANAGKLVVSADAYDKRVAGILSGAGGVKTGMMMGQKGSLANGEHAVALTGRVYCLVDASKGAIEPGDMLTTSDTPGHAMKVTNHELAQGAIIGKAMTSLAKGEQGLVLVLVSLQ